jgi:hypothetical protein
MAFPPKSSKEKPGAVLVAALGKPKSKARPSMEDDLDMMMGDEEEAETPPLSGAEDFEAYAVEAFPELASDPLRLEALRKMVLAVVKPKPRGPDPLEDMGDMGGDMGGMMMGGR